MNTPPPMRLAQTCGDTVQWSFKRNCSVTPGQLAATFALLASVSLTIAGFFWFMGVRMILPFAALELTAVAVAFVVYARRATNRERIELSQHRLLIEQEHAGRVTHVVFNRETVRVEARQSRNDLIEVCEGHRRVRCGHHIRSDLRDQVARELRMALKGF